MKNLKNNHSQPTVCLDAGHFGQYNQSPIVSEYYESDMVWTLHLLLKKQLEQRGIRVILTRSDKEKDLPLTRRGEASANADLFISLHSNAAAAAHPNWVVGMHFVDDNCGKIDEQSVEITEKLSKKVAQVMGVDYQIYTRKSSKDRDENGYQDDYYGVLRGAHSVGTPGLILEHGFHTNEENTRWLMDDENLQKLAVAEAQIIAEWFGIQQKMLDFSVPVLKKGAKNDTVRALQSMLNGFGLTCGAIDGSFGPATDKAVRSYQSAMGLTPDGSVGRATWTALLGLG